MEHTNASASDPKAPPVAEEAKPNDKEKIANLLFKAKGFAHCNCPENPNTGLVDYHSNCQRRLMPILEELESLL